ncbi:alpha/beta fold hydrolase [Streptomyces sp. JJ36]|uniref:alpha/beta fold hydrolase n=1 Tax=Streptomyces sp. JJ36 TaxID=2736645 RepID=UPI001F477DED|nr:alpha/beta fold hydrolase [Streptomyces sp. JJ36]MCF6525629.1 alpha/beta fold hydrolase [Streptomyces sp. JJ36]
MPMIQTRPASTEEAGTVTVGGFPCSYRLLRQPHARTEPLVLLGGALQDKYAWAPTEPTFHAVADVLTIDLPGWGDSPVLPARYDFGFLSDALAVALDHAGIHRANVIGACYGGITAYTFAARHPDRVARLGLASLQDGLTDEARAAFEHAVHALRRGDVDTFVGTVVDLYLPPSACAADRRRTAIARVLRSQLHGLTPRALGNYIEGTLRLLDFRPAWRPLPLPVLVLNGEQDTFTPPRGGRRLAGAMDADFGLIAGAGHMLGLERPVETAERLAAFVTGNRTTGTVLPQRSGGRA